jgi:hypothetical protein
MVTWARKTWKWVFFFLFQVLALRNGKGFNRGFYTMSFLLFSVLQNCD